MRSCLAVQLCGCSIAGLDLDGVAGVHVREEGSGVGGMVADHYTPTSGVGEFKPLSDIRH